MYKRAEERDNMTDLEIIARHYGLEEQSLQCIEEMAELTQAINKVHRKCSKENLDKMVEEIADVQIMIKQLIYLTNSDKDVKRVMSEKINRQLERMGKPK